MQPTKAYKTEHIGCLAVSDDGQMFASGNLDGAITIQHMGPANRKLALKDKAWVHGLKFSANGCMLVSSSSTGSKSRISVWEVASGRVRSSFEINDHVADLDTSPDGKLVALAQAGGVASLWDAWTHTQMAVFERHNNELLRVALGQDGRLMATTGLDAMLMIWNVPKGQ